MDNKMTAEQALPKPEDALAYLINRLVTPTSADAASNTSRSIESLRAALSAPMVPDRKGIPANYGYSPTADRPWLMYDPEGDGILFFVTEDEAVAAAEKAIDMSLDDFWSEQVDQICVARVMQLATQVDRVDRPESLNDEYAEDGEWWPNDCEFKCNYKLLPVAASPEPVAPDAQQVIDDLRAEVEALRKDADRLDWLGKNATRVSDSERYLSRRVYWGGGTNKDVREAIDAARLREGGEESLTARQCDRRE